MKTTEAIEATKDILNLLKKYSKHEQLYILNCCYGFVDKQIITPNYLDMLKIQMEEAVNQWKNVRKEKEKQIY
jgi:hypothetical protein